MENLDILNMQTTFAKNRLGPLKALSKNPKFHGFMSKISKDKAKKLIFYEKSAI